MELFSDWMGQTGGGQAVGRYAHYLGGITWIGLLYFFNFIQGAAFGEMSDGARGEALRKITWRTLWWFRWAAALTWGCLLYTSPSPRDRSLSRMPSSA